MPVLPNPLTNGTTADGSEVFENDAVLRDAIDNLKDANIVAGAGIDDSKLAKRFVNPDVTIQLIPATSGADISTPATFSLPQSMTTIAKEKVRLRSGQPAALVEVEWWVQTIEATGGVIAQVDMLVNSVVVGGEVKQLTTEDAYYSVGYSNPVDAPLLPLSDGDIIEYRVGKSGSGDTKIAGLFVRRQIKKGFVP